MAHVDVTSKHDDGKYNVDNDDDVFLFHDDVKDLEKVNNVQVDMHYRFEYRMSWFHVAVYVAYPYKKIDTCEVIKNADELCQGEDVFVC